MICPRVFKAGFIFGGEGGACVLLARAGNGTWSYPAFYGMGSGSFGLQIGIQDAEFIMMIMTEKGLHAMLDSQFKLGADASLAVATIGVGVQGSTTGALGADIVAFSQSRGLFGGISLEGSLMGQRTSGTRPITASRGRTADRHRHAGVESRRRSAARRADPLWQRRGAAGRGAAAAGSYQPQPAYTAAIGCAAAATGAPVPPAVQQQNLPPPRLTDPHRPASPAVIPGH